jgi:blocked-early-in-transport protein 1
MSQAYEREQQNNNRLDELASKVSALRGVTIDIYDNARDQHVIDSTVRFPFQKPSNFISLLKM